MVSVEAVGSLVVIGAVSHSDREQFHCSLLLKLVSAALYAYTIFVVVDAVAELYVLMIVLDRHVLYIFY